MKKKKLHLRVAVQKRRKKQTNKKEEHTIMRMHDIGVNMGSKNKHTHTQK